MDVMGNTEENPSCEKKRKMVISDGGYIQSALLGKSKVQPLCLYS